MHDLTQDVRELDLRLISPTTLDFQPGQFISFEIPIEGKPHPVTRAYSIASPPSQRGILTLVFNRVDQEPGSTFLFGLKPGDQIHFKEPAGSFRLRDDAPRNLLFVATGTGIAPIRSMLHILLPKATAQVVSLLWGLRAQRDLYYEEELHELTARHPMFHSTITLSRPDPGWTGPTGCVRSRATWATECPDSCTRRTAYSLNVSVYDRRIFVLMLSADFIILLLLEMSAKSGEA